MMIAHHQGAILMARVELADGVDRETTALAESIRGPIAGDHRDERMADEVVRISVPGRRHSA